jgi:transcriptional regulator GlxA family with amidase domain
MTMTCYFLPMLTTRKIVFLAYTGFDLLDVAGPASVFTEANIVLGKPAYDVVVVSPDGGKIASNGGLEMHGYALSSPRARGAHTVLVSGAQAGGLRHVLASESACRWIRKSAHAATRFGSVCAGAFVLAALGLLDDKRVTTHWSVCDRLAQRYPRLTVDQDALYVNDGKLWTSAGVTAGIDMALAMVEADHGVEVASDIARQLVLYARRPGYQTQFSPLLQDQLRADSPFASLMAWMQVNLKENLSVPVLAERVALSERTFYRKFSDAIGQSPAQYVESLRLDAARSLMKSDLSLKEIAAKTGMQSATRLSLAFTRRFGMAPSLFRSIHVA